jgi:hypothetical protein
METPKVWMIREVNAEGEVTEKCPIVRPTAGQAITNYLSGTDLREDTVAIKAVEMVEMVREI